MKIVAFALISSGGLFLAVMLGQSGGGAAPGAQGPVNEELAAAGQLADNGHFEEAIAAVYAAIDRAGATPIQQNAARLSLMSILAQTLRAPEIGQVAQFVIDEHARGRANGEQLARAQVWLGRSLIASAQFDAAADALAPALAHADGNLPTLACETEYLLGELCEARATAAKEERGPLHQQAWDHYVAALTRAKAAGLQEWRHKAALKAGWLGRHLGSPEYGVAWMRREIDDPARLSDLDVERVGVIGTFLTTQERDRWYRYLLDPAEQVDPTAVDVQAVFQQPASVASGAVSNQRSALLYLLARELQDQHRYKEAIELYNQAAALATSAYRKARALSALPKVYKSLGKTYIARNSTQPRPAARLQALKDGAEIAERALAVWLPVIQNGPLEQALEGVEACIYGFRHVAREPQAVEAIGVILAALPPDAHPRLRAYAARLHALALAWIKDSRAALEVAASADQEFSETIDPQVEEHWGMVLMIASAVCARDGYAAADCNFMPRVESRFPEGKSSLIDWELEFFHDRIERFYSVSYRN